MEKKEQSNGFMKFIFILFLIVVIITTGFIIFFINRMNVSANKNNPQDAITEISEEVLLEDESVYDNIKTNEIKDIELLEETNIEDKTEIKVENKIESENSISNILHNEELIENEIIEEIVKDPLMELKEKGIELSWELKHGEKQDSYDKKYYKRTYVSLIVKRGDEIEKIELGDYTGHAIELDNEHEFNVPKDALLSIYSGFTNKSGNIIFIVKERNQLKVYYKVHESKMNLKQKRLLETIDI